MTVLQLWLFIGVPTLLLALAAFVGRSYWRSVVGYLVLLAGFVAMTLFHPPSGAAVGAVLALVYASGRGGDREHGYDRLSDTGHRAVAAGG